MNALNHLIQRIGASWKNAPRPWSDKESWKQRQNNVDGVRTILALLVIWFHGPVLLGNLSDTPLLPSFAQEPLEQLHFVGVRVLCFFWLSGFLLARSWERLPNVGIFLWRRVLRLYPPFLVCAVICLLFILPIVSGAALPAWQTMSLSLLTFRIPGIADAFPRNVIDDTLNGSVWTLLYEAWCCVLLLLLGISGMIRRGTPLLLILSGLLIAYSLQWFGVLSFPLHWETDRTWTLFGSMEAYPRLVACFLSGVAFFRFRKAIPWHPALLVLSIGGLCLATVWGVIGPAIPLLGAYCLAYIAFHPYRRFSAWQTTGGNLSYGIFLYGYPVQQLWIHYVGAKIPAPVLFMLTVPFVSLLAYLSHRFVERPIAAWQKKIGTRSDRSNLRSASSPVQEESAAEP